MRFQLTRDTCHFTILQLHDQKFSGIVASSAFVARGDRSKIRPDFVAKVERVLARLNASATPEDMDVPGFGLHAMTGDRKVIGRSSSVETGA